MTPPTYPSPFPGMDPYLEDPALWPDFHRIFVVSLYQLLLPGLIDRYRACVAEKDLEVRQRSDDRLVTLVQVVSPANKLTRDGRQAYLARRGAGRSAGASLVEIDLVLQGQPTLDYSRAGLPHWDYAVTVVRAIQPERYEIYTTTLQKRLPRFRLPLAADDRDTVLDLQSVFTRTFAEGNFAARIDYASDPPGPLRDDDRRWLDELLVKHGLRGPMPPHEEIARAAYRLWEEEGRPQGRDRQHWQQALACLRRRAGDPSPSQ